MVSVSVLVGNILKTDCHQHASLTVDVMNLKHLAILEYNDRIRYIMMELDQTHENLYLCNLLYILQ